MENGTGSDSCEKKGQEGPWNHCLAGPISLVAQSGAKSKATAGLVFSAGPADSTGITSPWWLPRADRGRFVAAGGHAGGLHTGGSALTASSRLQTNQQRRNGNGRSLPGRLRPSIYPVSKLCSRSLLAGRLTLGRLGSRLGCARSWLSLTLQQERRPWWPLLLVLVLPALLPGSLLLCSLRPFPYSSVGSLRHRIQCRMSAGVGHEQPRDQRLRRGKQAPPVPARQRYRTAA